MAAAAPLPGEALIGWAVHYLSGTAFALALITASGADWLHAPTLTPALAAGIGTVVVPFSSCSPTWARASPYPTRRSRTLRASAVC
jgi:hypothetical protein